MSTLISVILIVAIYVVYASIIKLAAFLLRRSIISWKHCFLFSLIFVTVSTIIRAVLLHTGVTIPIPFNFVFGYLLMVAAGAWFFRTRITDSQGNIKNWRGGIQLMSIVYGLIVILGIIGLICIYIAEHLSKG